MLTGRFFSEEKEKWFSEYVDIEIGSLETKTVAITGTTSGMGYWAAVCAVRKKAKCLFLLNRNEVKTHVTIKALEKEKSSYASNTEIVFIKCDLKSFTDVKKAALSVISKLENYGLDVLINNAGVSFLPESKTEDGFNLTIQINYLSHFLLTKELFMCLEQAADRRNEARVVVHTSTARLWIEYNSEYFKKLGTAELEGSKFWSQRYSQTKLAACAFIEALNRKCEETNSKVIGVIADPGLATSNILEPLKNRKDTNVFKFLLNIAVNHLCPHQASADGAMPLVAAAFHSDTKRGDHFCPRKMFNLVGRPYKFIKEGVVQWWLFRESNWRKSSVYQAVWNASEIAIGELFQINYNDS